jgi:hypothetical protein
LARRVRRWKIGKVCSAQIAKQSDKFAGAQETGAMIDLGRWHDMEFAVAAEPCQQPAARTPAQEFRQLVQSATSRLRVATCELADQGHEPSAVLIDEAVDLLDRAVSLAHKLAPPPAPAGRTTEIVLVQQLIVSVGDRLRSALGDTIRLQTCVSGGTPAVRCPPRILEKILIELAVIARGAMPDGGALLIESRTRYAQDGQPHGAIVCVAVTSSGQVRASAIRPERTVRLRSRTGPDRGWSPSFRNVRRLVEEIGGSAELEQLPDGGSRVRLHLLPCAEGS